METWKDIEGTGGIYEVSNTGKIRSNNYLGHGSQKELMLAKDKKGYLRVRIYIGGLRKTIKVHRAVAIAFIPNPENKPEVNHKDGDKANNCVDNLEWATSSENVKHAYKSGLKENTREWCRRMGSTAGKLALEREREKRKTPLVAIRVSDGSIFEFSSQSEASEKTGAPQPNILKVLKGERKTSHGFVFRFKEVV